VDFWAQHKDFILKVLAGFGVFLVALIARGITYGEDLEIAQRDNRKLSGAIRSKKVVPRRTVTKLNRAAESLQANVAGLATEIGFDATDEKALRKELLTRTFRRLLDLRGEAGESAESLAARVLEALDVNLNGTFGALRLRARDEVLDEAGERNVLLPEDGLGFQSLVSIEAGDLLKHLLQLELVTRVVSDALGMEVRDRSGKNVTLRVAAIEEVRIDTQDSTPAPLPAANPQFLREYAVRVAVVGNEAAIIEFVNRLETGSPRVPIREMKAEKGPRDLIRIELTLLAVAVNVSVPFAPTTEENAQ